MSITDLSPELYLRELTGDYSLLESVLRVYLATNPNDTAWAEETLGQLMSSSSLPGMIHYVGVTCRQNGAQARLLEDLKSAYDAGLQRSAGGIRFSRLLQSVLQCCKLTGPDEVNYADSDGLLVLSCKTLKFQDEKILKQEVARLVTNPEAIRIAGRATLLRGPTGLDLAANILQRAIPRWVKFLFLYVFLPHFVQLLPLSGWQLRSKLPSRITHVATTLRLRWPTWLEAAYLLT